MQAQWASVLLLCLTSGGLCTDVDQDHRALEEDLLSSLFTSELKPNRQSALYWRQSVATLCRLVNRLRDPWQSEEEGQGEGLRDACRQEIEQLFSLSDICQLLQNQEGRLLRDSQEDSDGDELNSLKRKSPYILKRAAQSAKSRRPYILKRSTFY